MMNSHQQYRQTIASEVQSEVELEMDYTGWESSCLSPTITPEGDFRECRRAKEHNQHDTAHASGRGDYFLLWRG